LEKLKAFVVKHFEEVVVGGILVIVLLINFMVTEKMTMLIVYFLPVLLAGYILGRRMALLTAILCILWAIFLVLLDPKAFAIRPNPVFISLNVMIWAAFLVLAGILVGTLFELKERHIQELRTAYIGVLEILSKYLESADRYTKGHSLRVADTSTDIAMALGLTRAEVENIRAAALLHDIGKIDISSDLIRKAADLSQEEREQVDSHVQKGGRLLSGVGAVLRDAVPIIMAHHRYFVEAVPDVEHRPEIPMGARIVAVADAFDAMITDRPYRKGMPPWKAAEELEKAAGSQFDPEVVDAFKRVISGKFEEM